MYLLISFMVLTIVCDGVISHGPFFPILQPGYGYGSTFHNPYITYFIPKRQPGGGSTYNYLYKPPGSSTGHSQHHSHFHQNHHTSDCDHPPIPAYYYPGGYGEGYDIDSSEDYYDDYNKETTKDTTKNKEQNFPDSTEFNSEDESTKLPNEKITTNLPDKANLPTTSQTSMVTETTTQDPQVTADPFNIDIRFSDNKNTKIVTKRSTKDIEEITKPSFPLNSIHPFNPYNFPRRPYQPRYQPIQISCPDQTSECVPIYKCKFDNTINPRSFCRFSEHTPYVCCEKPVNKVSLRLDAGCGRKKSSGKSAAIIGGVSVENRISFPWMVAIGQIEKNLEVDWFCGGALVSAQTVVTAAHCLGRRSADIVRLGETDLTEKNSESYQEIYVWRRFIHPLYRPPSMYQDIALVYLHEAADFTKFVKPICLPRRINNSGLSVLTGWGQLSFDTEKSDVLQEVTLQIINNTMCDKIYSLNTAAKRNFPKGILDSQICAGDENGGKDACQGDSGSPLVAEEDDNFVLTGIVSAGIGCGSKVYPGIYTRVFSFVPWILENMI